MKKKALGTGFDTLAVRHGTFTGREEVFFRNAPDQIAAFDLLMAKRCVSYHGKLNGECDVI
jgi:hypothetical protein